MKKNGGSAATFKPASRRKPKLNGGNQQGRNPENMRHRLMELRDLKRIASRERAEA